MTSERWMTEVDDEREVDNSGIEGERTVDDRGVEGERAVDDRQ